MLYENENACTSLYELQWIKIIKVNNDAKKI